MFNEQKSSADHNNLYDMIIHFNQTLATSQLENVLTFFAKIMFVFNCVINTWQSYPRLTSIHNKKQHFTNIWPKLPELTIRIENGK